MTWRNRIVAHDNVPPDQLLANPANWRIHPQPQQDALSAVIAEVGYVVPVLVRAGSDEVLDGHLRVRLALRDNEPTIPVTYVDVSDAEAALILATLDPLAAMAGTDAAQLAALLAEARTDEAATQSLLDALAKDNGIGVEAGGGLTDPDDVPVPPADPITKPGDLWRLGRHRLLCGDAAAATDVARLMGGERAAMVFTDPPYGVDYDGGSGNATKRTKMAGDAFGVSPAWLTGWRGYATDRTPFYIWFADRNGRRAYDTVEDAGLHVRALIVWNKLNAHYGAYMAQYLQKHEPCLYCHIGAPAWYGPTNEVTVWDVEQPARNEFHPTQKPTVLAERAIANSSAPGDLVLDLFGGSGSTLIACEQTGRRCAMLEIDPIYCDVIVRRFEQFTCQTAEIVRPEETP